MFLKEVENDADRQRWRHFCRYVVNVSTQNSAVKFWILLRDFYRRFPDSLIRFVEISFIGSFLKCFDNFGAFKREVLRVWLICTI